MFIITGGSSGIGREIAYELARRRHQTLIVGRREHYLRETAAFSPLITWCCTDIATNAGREVIYDNISHIDRIQGIVHNAGTIEPLLPMASISEATWEHTLATNLNAPLFLSQHLMPKIKGGRILHIGSGAAYFPVQGWAAYCVAKAGLAMLTRCWQLELDMNIAACASVMPGIIDTDMQGLIRNSACMQPEKLQFFKNLSAEGHLLAPATVALFICWLLLTVDTSAYVAQEWDIYDASHHFSWLVPPHKIHSLS